MEIEGFVFFLNAGFIYTFREFENILFCVHVYTCKSPNPRTKKTSPCAHKKFTRTVVSGLIFNGGNGGNCLWSLPWCPFKSSNRNLQILHRGALCQGKIALPLQVRSIRPVVSSWFLTALNSFALVATSRKSEIADFPFVINDCVYSSGLLQHCWI